MTTQAKIWIYYDLLSARCVTSSSARALTRLSPRRAGAAGSGQMGHRAAAAQVTILIFAVVAHTAEGVRVACFFAAASRRAAHRKLENRPDRRCFAVGRGGRVSRRRQVPDLQLRATPRVRPVQPADTCEI
jgi:hypothetical protein